MFALALLPIFALVATVSALPVPSIITSSMTYTTLSSDPSIAATLSSIESSAPRAVMTASPTSTSDVLVAIESAGTLVGTAPEASSSSSLPSSYSTTSWSIAASISPYAMGSASGMSSLFPLAIPTMYSVPTGSVTRTSSSATSTSSSTTTSSPTYLNDTEIAAIDSLPRTSWRLSPSFTSLVPAFSITSFPDGASNIAIIPGPAQTASPTPYIPASSDAQALSSPDTFGSSTSDSSNLFRVEYPAGSINPGNKVTPIGGAEFYATPLKEVKTAENVTLEYSVFFPEGFDFVQGGKLPGLYGGHKGCSGGDAAVDCFSTRLMWRTSGFGELYLYAPKSSQSPSLCHTPPKSVCEAAYGLSIGRGAWTFQTGEWTHVRQDVWLNTPGVQNGGFNIFINGKLVLSASNVFYRQNADYVGQAIFAAAVDTTGPDNSGDGSDLSLTNITGISPMDSLVDSTKHVIVAAAAGGFAAAEAFTPSVIQHTPTAQLTQASVPTMDATEAALAEVIEMVGHHGSPGPMNVSMTTVTLGTVLVPISTRSTVSSSTATAPANATGMLWEAKPIDAFAQSSGSVSMTMAGADGTVTATQTRIAIVTVTATSTIHLEQNFVSHTSMAPFVPVATPSPVYNTPINLVDYTVDPSSLGISARSIGDNATMTAASKKKVIDEAGAVGFIGIFLSTFFGGHSQEWASPTDQYTYFKDFSMRISV